MWHILDNGVWYTNNEIKKFGKLMKKGFNHLGDLCYYLIDSNDCYHDIVQRAGTNLFCTHQTR